MEIQLERARAMLILTPDRWQDFCRELPAELLKRRPAIGEWSALECLQHLIDSEPVYQYRVSCFLDGKDFPNFDPDRDGTKTIDCTPAELADGLSKLRTETIKILTALNVADLDRRARHQTLGPVTLGEMLNNWAAHDLNHTIQAERALMQPYLQVCGPWIEYYRGHQIEAGQP